MKTLRTKTTKRKNAKRPRTLPRVARAAKRVPSMPEAPKTAPPAAEPPKVDAEQALKEDVTPFINFDQTVNPKAPLAMLVPMMFSDYIEIEGLHDPAAKLLADVLRASADEADLILAVGDEEDHSTDIARVLRRATNRNRNRIAVEIARRIQTGEVAL